MNSVVYFWLLFVSVGVEIKSEYVRVSRMIGRVLEVVVGR